MPGWFRPLRVVLVVGWLAAWMAQPDLTRSATGWIEQVSVAPDGAAGNEASYFPEISADGRYAAFTSFASNLVEEDTNGVSDIFVRDRQKGTTERVSVSSNGEQALGASDGADISPEARWIAYHSGAANLVEGDTNGRVDVFVHDRQTGLTERVSISTGSVQGNEDSWNPAISADGRYVAFTSYASNLDDKDTNQEPDVFLRDRQTGLTRRISVDSRNNQGNRGSFALDISPDGRYVVYSSLAWNLVAGDQNRFFDIFVYDGQTKTVERVSVSSSGEEGNGDSYAYPASISADGRYVAFGSYASNLVAGDENGKGDVFVHDRQTGKTELVSVSSSGEQANDDSPSFHLSADGRYVTFSSAATNLAAGDENGVSDIFLHDRQTGSTELVSISNGGEQANGASDYPATSANGGVIAFSSQATNLVSGDMGGFQDIFVYGPALEPPPGTRYFIYLPIARHASP